MLHLTRLQEQELDALLDRFYVKPARGTGSEATCLAQGLDGVIEAAQHIFQEVGQGIKPCMGGVHDERVTGFCRRSPCEQHGGDPLISTLQMLRRACTANRLWWRRRWALLVTTTPPAACASPCALWR